jgi:soluble lytic murein transglycosylase-like protein
MDYYCGDIRAALSAYNLGPTRYKRWKRRTGKRYYYKYLKLIKKNLEAPLDKEN